MNGLDNLLGIAFSASHLRSAHQPSNGTPIRHERTPEQIRGQLEARMAELERQAVSPRIAKPCASCRHVGRRFTHMCRQPLIKGFESKDQANVDFQTEDLGISEGEPLSSNWPNVALCGHEKALWEPIPTRWQRFVEWLHRVIQKLEA